MKRVAKMLFLLVLVVFLASGCASLKKANSELNPADVAAMSQTVQANAGPFVPLPFQPLVPFASAGLGYVICLIRQMYKDHMAEAAKLKADAAAKT